MILLTAAVEKELQFWTPRENVRTLVTGVGVVEAAAAVAAALAGQRYELVINAGIAGAFDGAAAVGDSVAVAEERFELDLETGAPIELPGRQRTIERAHSDAALIARLQAQGLRVVQGVTVSRVTSTEQTAVRLAAGGAEVESMEGFAVLRAAELAGVRAVEVRGISNRVGARERSGWSFEAGARGLQHALGVVFSCL